MINFVNIFYKKNLYFFLIFLFFIFLSFNFSRIAFAQELPSGCCIGTDKGIKIGDRINRCVDIPPTLDPLQSCVVGYCQGDTNCKVLFNQKCENVDTCKNSGICCAVNAWTNNNVHCCFLPSSHDVKAVCERNLKAKYNASNVQTLIPGCPSSCEMESCSSSELIEPTRELVIPFLNIKIPNLDFTLRGEKELRTTCAVCKDKKVSPSDCPSDQCATWNYSFPWIGQYLSAVYQWLVVAAAILAVIMIIISGVRIVNSRGNAPAIKDAWSGLWAALLGLAFVLIFVPLFSFINFKLVQLPTINVGSVTKDVLIEGIGGTSGGGKSAAISGDCLPVAKNSFREISWNFGSRRSSTRCHAGVDILSGQDGNYEALAISGGNVVNIFGFKTGDNACTTNTQPGYSTGGDSSAIAVKNDDGSYVIYGEINSNEIAVRLNQRVEAGTYLGKASACGMVHFEIRNSNIYPQWNVGEIPLNAAPNYCRNNELWDKRNNLEDPTNTIAALESKLCDRK